MLIFASCLTFYLYVLVGCFYVNVSWVYFTMSACMCEYVSVSFICVCERKIEYEARN